MAYAIQRGHHTNDARVRMLTGAAGVAIAVLAIATIPLYFMYPGPPPAWNVFTRTLISLVSCAAFIVFFTGFRHLLRGADPAIEWPASVFQMSGILFVAVTLVAMSHEAGVVFGAPDGTLDPTVDGPLAEGNILIHGSIKRMLMAMLLVAGGYAATRAQLIPRWLGVAAYVVALFNLFFLPSMFFGTDVTRFYSAHGWGNSAFCASFLLYWMLAVGIVLLRKPLSQ